MTAADSAFQSGVGREVAEGEEDSLPPVRQPPPSLAALL